MAWGKSSNSVIEDMNTNSAGGENSQANRQRLAQGTQKRGTANAPLFPSRRNRPGASAIGALRKWDRMRKDGIFMTMAAQCKIPQNDYRERSRRYKRFKKLGLGWWLGWVPLAAAYILLIRKSRVFHPGVAWNLSAIGFGHRNLPGILALPEMRAVFLQPLAVLFERFRVRPGHCSSVSALWTPEVCWR